MAQDDEIIVIGCLGGLDGCESSLEGGTHIQGNVKQASRRDA
jgi:hypothetical protein